jgi:CheY-like chemotaxis protein
MGEPVLIVDDHPANLRLLSFLLQSRGYQVRTAADGEELKVVLASFRPRLILMDIELPGVDGLELTRQLKAAPETRGIIVLALTARAMRGDEAKALAAGCDGYITKPIDTRGLPGTIAGILGRR